ncbi:MAG: hypothetical protein JXB17_05040 [Bacteroidales bacterium]|nr:hypothetical protein [Bacteroidales bacterium]
MQGIERLFSIFNKADTRILIFLLLCLNFLGFVLYPNEEQYLAFSKIYIDPQWIPNSFSLTDVAGTRILFQLIFGFLLQYFSFESVAFGSRLINFIFYSIILAKIFKKFKLTNSQIFIFLQLIYFSYQSFFAGEWLFMGIEAKTISYIFLLYSLYNLFEKKYFKTILFAAFSTWFHILVGGWYALIVFIYFFVYKVKLKSIIHYGFEYCIMILPFIIYLYYNYIKNNGPSVINGININYIYVYLRNPHHLAIFKDWATFNKHFITGISLTIIMFFICVFYFRKIKDPYLKQLNTLNIILFSQQLFCLLLAAIDKKGVFLKYYPFRTSALSMLLVIIQLLYYFRIPNEKIRILKLFTKNKYIFQITRLTLFIFAFAVLIVNSINNLNKNLNYFSKDNNKEKAGLYNYIKNNTDKYSVFFIYSKNENLSFIRSAERDVFSVGKFIPTQNHQIYMWYLRTIEQEKAVNNIEYLFKLKEKYRIDYVVSGKELPDNFKLVYSNSLYFLYKI